MSKYDALSAELEARTGSEWRASFAELEGLLGFALPKAARGGRAWWANDPDKGHSRAWTARGWEVGDVDHAAERVVFRRGAASGAVLVQAADLRPLAPEPPRRGRIDAKKALAWTAVLAAGAAALAGVGAMVAKGLRRSK